MSKSSHLLPYRPIWGGMLLLFLIINGTLSVISFALYASSVHTGTYDVMHCNDTMSVFEISDKNTCNGTVTESTLPYPGIIFHCSVGAIVTESILMISGIVIFVLIVMHPKTHIKSYLIVAGSVCVLFALLFYLSMVFQAAATYLLGGFWPLKGHSLTALIFAILNIAFKLVFMVPYAGIVFKSERVISKVITLAIAQQCEYVMIYITSAYCLPFFLGLALWKILTAESTTDKTPNIISGCCDFIIFIVFAVLLFTNVLYQRYGRNVFRFSVYFLMWSIAMLIFASLLIVFIVHLIRNSLNPYSLREGQKMSSAGISLIIFLLEYIYASFAFTSCLVVAFVRFRALTRDWFKNAAKNVDVDLSAPFLQENPTVELFEKEIQQWIIDFEDLTYDQRISEGMIMNCSFII
jgi:hypothetical protein